MTRWRKRATHEDDSHATFLKQGGWLVLATVTSGIFMVATQVVAQRGMEPSEYVLWFALLRVYLLMGIPAMGLQVVFAQQTAAAVDVLRRHQLAGTLRAVLQGTFGLWLILALVAWVGQPYWLTQLKIRNAAALWATVFIGLASLWVPVLRGVLQGRQHFSGLGWVLILDGLGRVLAVGVIVALGGQAAGGMFGALIGQVISLWVGVWLIRDLLRQPGEPMDWRPWLGRVVPLTLGTGAVLFLSSADVVYVQTVFSVEQTPAYVPAAMVGLALVTFTAPLMAVMFPKVARSAALTTDTRALEHALGATALAGGLAVLACVLFPELPLRIIYYSRPAYWAAAPLVPWFVGCLFPLVLGNVLLGNLLARERFGVVPWLVLLALAYGATLARVRPALLAMETFAAFRTLLLILGGFNLALLAVAIWFSWREAVRAGAEGR